MPERFRHTGSLLIAATLLLAACAGPSASLAPTEASTPKPAAAPSARPATQPAVATQAPEPTSAHATEASATEPPIAAATQTPMPTEAVEPGADVQPPPTVDGQVVLKLGAGSGPDQVGVLGEAPNIVGPRSFRIGADGSIRVLDNVNRRVLFFDLSGKVTRTLRLDASQEAVDFIVNNAGEVFVYSGDGRPTFKVLRFGPDGKLTAQLPVSPGVSADGIMLTAAQDLMLIQGNQTYWTLLHQGVTVDPKIQPLTMQAGAVTPRSPAIFRTLPGENGTVDLHAISLNAGISGENVIEIANLTTRLPPDARFFNVDRAMNLYFTRTTPDGEAMDVWRVLPDGTIAGGAHILRGSCGASWRTFYVDQVGAAWTMCVDSQGATVSRYSLQDSDGQPLPEAAQEAADVAWKPGARLNAA